MIIKKLRKNILVIAGGNYISGAEKITLQVIEGLKEAGHHLFCITSGWTDGVFPLRLSKMCVGYKELKLGWYYISNLKWSMDSLIHYPASFLKFYKFIKRNKYDLVYTMSYRYIILLYPILKRNIIFHVHDPHSSSRQSKFFLHLIDKKVIKYIAVSEFIKRDLIACGIKEEKVEVIYNGVEIIKEFTLETESISGSLTLGIVGQVIPRKGHEDVLTALKILKQKQLVVSLIIVGKGDEKFMNELKSFIAKNHLTENVEWRDFRESLVDIYEGIDIVVAPTRSDEPFALVALEANMLSIPVIATNKGGFPESIEDGLNGFLIEASNPFQLAEKLSILYYDRALLKALGENGRKRIIKNFTKEKMVNNANSFINRLLLYGFKHLLLVNKVITRKLDWLSCSDASNFKKISILESMLSDFYFHNADYYNNIDFTAGNWIQENEIGYMDILRTAKCSGKILEVGCGSANILKHHPDLQHNYYGCDFSKDLINLNCEKYPQANFTQFSNPNILPYENSGFDLVFSVFVLEHSTNPPLFLDECVRSLKKDGVLIILCPDFLSCGRMTSQRAGFSQGPSRYKLMKKKYFDAAMTLFDNRIRIPLYCKYLSYTLRDKPKFYINVNPIVFSDDFTPDVDAVYVTSKKEIVKYLVGLNLMPNNKDLRSYESDRKIIYLKFTK